MNFKLTPTQSLFRQMIREFAEKEVKPLAAEIDEQERFPIETVQKMAPLGLFGIPLPVEYGGAGGDNIMYTIAVEELSRVCATTGVVLSAHTSLCLAPIFEHGTEEQKRKYLPKLASGEWLGAFGLTEPNAGTDASAQQTTAVLDQCRYGRLGPADHSSPRRGRVGAQRQQDIHHQCRPCPCLRDFCHD